MSRLSLVACVQPQQRREAAGEPYPKRSTPFEASAAADTRATQHTDHSASPATSPATALAPLRPLFPLRSPRDIDRSVPPALLCFSRRPSMELDFSSEREDYDDDPTAAKARAATGRDSPPLPPTVAAARPKSSSRNRVAPQPPIAQKPVQGGWGAAAPASSSNSSRTAPAPAPASSSGGGGFFASLTKAKPASSAAPASKVASSTIAGGVEEIQAFNPADMELSVSRKASESRSHSSKRRRDKAEKAAAAEARRKRLENAAPGAIDDGPPSARKTPVASKPLSGGAAFLPSSSASAAAIPIGSGANKSMIDGMGRKGGKGAFALSTQLDFSSEEDEEDGKGGTVPRKKAASKKHAEEKKDGGGGRDESQGEQKDVAPLINDVALDFVKRRWIQTLLGGVAPCWSAKPSDERQPPVPTWIIGLQIWWILYPVLVCLILNALHYHGVIARSGIMAVIAGAIVCVWHLALHSAHRSIVSKGAAATANAATTPAASPGRKSTRVADESSSSAPAPKPKLGVSHDNFEAELQALVKAAAIKAGTLPAKKSAASKKTKKEEEREDSASRPPDVPARSHKPVVADDDDDNAVVLPPGTPPLGITSPAVWAFIISPAAPSLLRILIHGLASGVLAGGAAYFLEWSSIALHFSRDSPATDSLGAGAIVYLVAAWLSFGLCFYALNIRPPSADPNQFGSEGGGWVQEQINAPFGRAIIVAAIIVYDIALRLTIESDPMSVAPVALDVHSVLLIVFVFLPLLFASGALPPVDALVWWALEQLNVVVFAGSIAANNVRTLAWIVIHTACATAVFLIWLFESHTGAMLFALGLSFFFSWNPLPLRVGAAPSPDAGSISPDEPYLSFNSRTLLPLRLSTIAKLFLGAVAIIAGLVLTLGVDASTDTDLIDALGVFRDVDFAFDIAALLLCIVLVALSELYLPYVCFNQFRNPFYNKLVQQAVPLKAAESVPRTTKHEVFLWISRAFLCVYVCFHQRPDLFVRGLSQPPALSELMDSKQQLTLFAYSCLLLRAFNSIWSQTLQSFVHALLVVVINFAAEQQDAEGWVDLDWSVRFLITGFVWSRFRSEVLPKTWFWLTLSYTSFCYPKLRMRHHALMRLVCVLLIPYHVALILVASFLAAPVIPLLGSPILILGYPRPQRIWASFGGKYGMNESSGAAANGGPDTVFYKQMLPSIYSALDRGLRNGQLTHLSSLEAGGFFLLRLEPYLLWGAVLERGLGYVIVQLKGLELQSTSCHTVEALRIDENCERILEGPSRPLLNPLSPLYAYQPLTVLRGVSSWSITKNVLTGIIDDLGNLQLLSATFLRMIVCNLVGAMREAAAPGAGRQLELKSLPEAWCKPTVSNYDLQQLEAVVTWPASYLQSVLGDSTLSEADTALLRKVALSLFAIVETLASHIVAAQGKIGPKHVLQTWCGKVGTSLYSDWVLAPTPDATRLKSLVIRSYRYAFKALYDCAALGSLEVLSGVESETLKEFQALIDEYDREWILGLVSDPEWEASVTRGDGHKLFTIAQSTTQSNQYTSLTLEMTKVKLQMASLSQTSIRSFWASLNLELLYFANDDDERYSIQAHPQLLRNLTVQTSEPPFGYPVYSGLPTILSTN